MPPLPTVLEAKRFGVYHCSPDVPLLEAARRMVQEDISALVVTDSQGYLCGVLSRTDVLRAHLTGPGWETVPVREYMSREVVTVEANDQLDEVAALLLQRHIHRVVVVRTEGQRQRPIAVVSDSDLVYHLVRGAA